VPLVLGLEGSFLLAAALAVVLSHLQGKAPLPPLTSNLLWLSGKKRLRLHWLTATLVQQQAACVVAQNATAQGADHLRLPVGCLFW